MGADGVEEVPVMADHNHRALEVQEEILQPILPKTRMSVLKQDQNAYDAYNVMDTVIMGNQRLYDRNPPAS